MLSEKFKPLKGLAPAADRFNTNPGSDVFSMANLESITFLVYHQGGTTGKARLRVQGCDNVTPSNTTDLPFQYRRMTTGDADAMGAILNAAAADTIETVPTEDTIIEIRCLAADLPADRPFVRLKTDETVNDPVNAVVIALGELKYQGTTPPTVIA